MSDSSRVIWVIRHAEREDNINPKNWMVKATNPHGLKYDNSPLSSRGRKQAKELAERSFLMFICKISVSITDIYFSRFSKVPIDHVFASPYERTVETATILLQNKNILIKPEPGLIEVCKNF
jgi:broad specificity phosphatase PhoE